MPQKPATCRTSHYAPNGQEVHIVDYPQDVHAQHYAVDCASAQPAAGQLSLAVQK